MTIYEVQYRQEIDTVEDYRITKEQFIKEITESNLLSDFIHDIQTNEDDFYTAVDWSIPVMFVEYFKKNL